MRTIASDDLSKVCLSFFLRYWGLNLASCLLGRRSTTWTTQSALFCDGYFQDRVSRTICWLWTLIFLISASWVARITGVSDRCPAIVTLSSISHSSNSLPSVVLFFLPQFFLFCWLWTLSQTAPAGTPGENSGWHLQCSALCCCPGHLMESSQEPNRSRLALSTLWIRILGLGVRKSIVEGHTANKRSWDSA
jgi:hypothetical protein